MNIAKCINCGVMNQNKPVTWVLVEYPLSIGLCYDCDNGTNKRKFWDKKSQLISKGAVNSGKPAVTALSEEEIKEFNKPLVQSRKKVKLDQVPPRVEMEKALKTPSPAAPVLPLRTGGEFNNNYPAFSGASTAKAVLKSESKKAMKTKIIWVVSTEDPTANDLMTIKSFVEHFSAGDEDIDIKTGKHRILVKNDKPEDENHLDPVVKEKPLSKYMQKKQELLRHSPLKAKKLKKDKPGKKFKSGAKLGAVNNSGWPTIKGRQPWVRCTGCGEYKGKKWSEQNEKLHIGLCMGCAVKVDLKERYDKKVEDLSSGRAA